MKKRLTFISALAIMAIASLAACGGGASGSPIPQPAPTTKPQNIVTFAVQSLGSRTQSGTINGQSLPLATTCGSSGTSSAIVAQAMTGYQSTGGNYRVLYFPGQFVQATEYDANCNVISSSPTYSGQSSTVAVVNVKLPAGYPTPAPGATVLAGGTPGKANVIATFTDGTTASIPMVSYSEIVFACPQDNWYSQPANGQAGPGWSNAKGYNVTWGTSANSATQGCSGFSQIYPGNPQPDVFNDTSSSIGQVYVPGGYQMVKTSATSADLANVTSCSTFASQGTSFSTTPNTASPGLVAGGFLMLFKTADEKCVKFLDLGMEPALVGLYAVSDASGNFAY